LDPRVLTWAREECARARNWARKLRPALAQRDSRVREARYASPRTQDGEGSFAAYGFADVKGGTFGEAATRARRDNRVLVTIDHRACSATVQLTFFACRWRRPAAREPCVAARISGPCAQLRRSARPLDDDLDVVSNAPLVAHRDQLPRAGALRRWSIAGARDRRESGYLHVPLAAPPEPIRTVLSVHRQRTRCPRRDALDPTGAQPAPDAVAIAAALHGETQDRRQQGA
jgi:hypothetical protein